MQGGASQSGFEDPFGVLYSVKLKIRPVNRLPDQAKVLNVPHHHRQLNVHPPICQLLNYSLSLVHREPRGVPRQ
jgi:hypothetical protein